MTRLEQKVAKLKKMFPNIRGIKAGEVWGAAAGSIHLGDAAEGGRILDATARKLQRDPEVGKYFQGPEGGTQAADYYGEFRGGYPWVHPDLEKGVKSIGYHIEWWDPGTLIAYPDDAPVRRHSKVHTSGIRRKSGPQHVMGGMR